MNQAGQCCDDMQQALMLEEIALEYNPKYREYGIRVTDGGTSVILIEVCPWCGKKLPSSLRDQWFEMLEKLGLDPCSDSIPKELTDSTWWERWEDAD